MIPVSFLWSDWRINCQTACKPGSVRTEARDDHSSGTHLAARLARPTRTAERECSRALRRRRPYSVLLPVGFALPPLLPGARCALAAPFRPCPRAASRRLRGRCVFCGTFPGVAPAGGYPAPYSRGARTFLCRILATAAVRPSGNASSASERGTGQAFAPIASSMPPIRQRVLSSASPVIASGRQCR